jgi:peptide/nickel transport system ATP-binding protein
MGVMVSGQLVQLADKHTLFGNPQNPPSGCTFHPRCPQATDICRAERPALRDFKGIKIACHAVV